MPRFAVNYDKTKFVPEGSSADGIEMDAAELVAAFEAAKAEGLVPDGVSGISRATANADDVIRKGEDTKLFVSIDLIIEADSDDDAHYAAVPGKLLAFVAERLHPDLDGMESGWDVLETTPVPEAAPGA